MMGTFNLYCDESCHLENDPHTFMLLGFVKAPYNQIKRHKSRISTILKQHNFYYELKWSNLSDSKFTLYKEIVEYFFDAELSFRAIIVNKNEIKNENFHQDFNTFYYKMYYQLLNHNINMENRYNVYLDIKDDLSADKVHTLQDIMNVKYGVFRNIQNIRSHESIFIQLCDILLGAVSYQNNNLDKKVTAKNRIIDMISKQTKHDLRSSTYPNEEKFNLFFIRLQ